MIDPAKAARRQVIRLVRLLSRAIGFGATRASGLRVSTMARHEIRSRRSQSAGSRWVSTIAWRRRRAQLAAPHAAPARKSAPCRACQRSSARTAQAAQPARRLETDPPLVAVRLGAGLGGPFSQRASGRASVRKIHIQIQAPSSISASGCLFGIMSPFWRQMTILTPCSALLHSVCIRRKLSGTLPTMMDSPPACWPSFVVFTPVRMSMLRMLADSCKMNCAASD